MVQGRASRWIPTAAMMLLSLLSYVDRNVLAILSPTILRDTHISAADYGWIISAFSFAYLVGNPVWGRLLDRFGVRVGVATAAALWTCASAGHAFATGVASFAIARAVLGFGEGATFPGGLRTSTHTLEPESRGRGVALAYSGGSLGAIITPLIVTPVALRWGWRGAFACTGGLGVAWLMLWAAVSSRPELRAPARDRRGPGPSLRDRSLWGFMAAYALGGLPIGFVIYGAPIHLGHGLGCDQRTLGHVLWLPPLGWEVGYFFWGWVMDRVARREGGASSATPKLLIVLTVLTLPLAATHALPGVAIALSLFILATFTAGGFIIVALAYAARVFSMRDAALIAGIGAGSWSAFVALLMPIFGRLFDTHAYAPAFALATAVPVLGLLGWGAIDRRFRGAA